MFQVRFQSKNFRLTLWKLLDRVLAFHFLSGQTTRRALAATDFLSCMQSDPLAISKITFSDRFAFSEADVKLSANFLGFTDNFLQPFVSSS